MQCLRVSLSHHCHVCFTLNQLRIGRDYQFLGYQRPDAGKAHKAVPGIRPLMSKELEVPVCTELSEGQTGMTMIG